MTRRIERVNSIIQQEISDLLRRECKDPRIGDFVSITDVETAPDLSRARVFVSHIGSEEQKRETISALTSAAGFLRGGLIKRLSLRHVPELVFEWDSSIERGSRVMELLDQVGEESRHEKA